MADNTIHNVFNTYEEIGDALREGKKVKWANDLYDVEYWKQQGWIMVKCSANGHTIGLGTSEKEISQCYIV